MTAETALIIGAGSGLSAALARRAHRGGMKVALAARNVEKLAPLAAETGALTFACDVTDEAAVDALFAGVQDRLGLPALTVFNAAIRVRGPVAELDPAAVKQVLLTSAWGGFLVGRAAARAMLPRGSGSIFFTGASASVKGYALSAPFAMGKFGLRGLVQSMARELAPKGLHVAHFVIDGGIAKTPEPDAARLDPDAIAESYFHIHRQPRSAWTWEMELRPWVETF
jgi:NAD(P)-dependent dehydrogenase (short-subunit alcohol dehydrogenase family)